MTFDNVISLLDAAAGRLVTLPGPVAELASGAGSTILSTDGDLPDAANVGDLCISQKDGSLYMYSGNGWLPVSVAGD